MRSRKFLFVAVLALGTLCLITDQCYARGGLFSSLFGRRNPGVNTHDSQSCEKPHPAVARIWIQQGGGERFGGTAILIDKLDGSGLAVSAAHCFSGVGMDDITLEFPNGEKFKSFMFAQDIAGDLALLTLDAPAATPVDIYLGTPKAGETSFIAGYGSGCYRTLKGSIRGYLKSGDGKMDSIHVTGLARPGDSGGPITNAQGELIGVLSGTWDNRRQAYYGTTVGAYNGRLCQFLNKEFSLPWKKDRRTDDSDSDEGDSDVEGIPFSLIVDEPVVDDEARQLLRDVLSRITDLDRAVEEAADREDDRASALADNAKGNFEVPPIREDPNYEARKRGRGEVDDFGIDPRPDRDKLDGHSGMEIVTISGVEEIEQQTSPPSVADIVARELLRNVRESIDELDRTVSDANIRAAERAQLFADGQRMIQEGLTDETIDAASEAAQPILVRWLEGMGVSGWVAIVVIGILLVVLVRWLKTNTADVRSGKTKSIFTQAAAKTTWKGDDAVARGIDKRAYGIEVLKETQAETQAEAQAEAQAE